MDIELTAQLLKEENIISFFTNTSIEQDRKQDENYSKLLKNDEIWGFYFVTCERNSEGNSEKLNEFFDEADACKYYYLLYHEVDGRNKMAAYQINGENRFISEIPSTYKSLYLSSVNLVPTVVCEILATDLFDINLWHFKIDRMTGKLTKSNLAY